MVAAESTSLREVWRTFEPPPDWPILLWMMRHFRTVDAGVRDFDHWMSPHIGAPGGPCEAFQDPRVREIYLQFASRMFKTQFCLGAALWISDVWPSPCFFASATRDLVEQTISNRAWPMAEECGRFGDLPVRGRRPKRQMRLPRNRWETGWAESTRTLADKSAKLVHCNEVDKWRVFAKATEGDPLDLARERAKEWPDRKILVESTPAIRKRSRIEAGRLSGTNCRYFVPCPRCGRYQPLVLGKGEPGSIAYDSGSGGRRDGALAYQTARYICGHAGCHTELRNDARPTMMRRGVWVPEGCDIDHDAAAALFDGLEPGSTHWGENPLTFELPEKPRYQWNGWASASWVRGTPARDADRASYHISTLYALSVGWGDIAKEWVESQGKPAKLQNFINSWLAETFAIEKREEDWEALAKRMISPVERFVVPEGFSIVSVGVDRQKGFYVYVVLALGPNRLPAVIDYGIRETKEQIRADVLLRTYRHADGGAPVPVLRSLLDTGYKPTEEDGRTPYHFCRETSAAARVKRLPLIFHACKGSSRPLNAPFRVETLSASTACPGATLVHVDTQFTQEWLDQQIYPGGDECRLRIFRAEPHEHEDFVVQLTNDAPIDDLDRQNNPTVVWQRIDEQVPNDYRDATRYAFAAALHGLRNGPVPPRVVETEAERADRERRKQQQPKPAGLQTPWGQPFSVLDRR